MKVNQIYGTVNAIAKTMKLGTDEVVDYASFVNFGNAVLSSDTNKEQFYNTLVDRIGRTIYAIREYKAADRNMLVDSFTFGSILQKISYKLQDAETSTEWEKDPSSPYDVEAKEGIIQKLFAQDMPTFSYVDVVFGQQLESAFVSAEAMGGFINGIYTRAYNAKEQAIEGMNNYAVGGLVAKVQEEVTAGTGTKRIVNLVSDYNTKKGTSLTAETAMSSVDFLEYACVEMGTTPAFLKKLSLQYNDGTVERFTPESDLVVEVNTEFEKSFNVYLKSSTFHDQLVALPNYSDIPYWENPNKPMLITKADGSEAVKNVIAIFRDKDAVVTTLEREKMIAQYLPWSDRTAIKLTSNRRFIADTSENVVIFTLN